MSIIRVVHNQENPFVQLNKKALWDTNLSLKAVGLWARCMSRPDNWRFNIKELAANSKEGRRAIDSAISELIDHGYAVRVEYWEKSDDGKFTTKGFEYIFFEFTATEEDKIKVLEEFKKSFRNCCFGNLRDGDLRNEHLLIKKENTNKEETKKEGEGVNAPALLSSFDKKIERQPHVTTTEEEHKKLETDYGKAIRDESYSVLSDWKLDTPKSKWKKDDNRSIRRWVIDAIQEKSSKSKNISVDISLKNKELAKKAEKIFMSYGLDSSIQLVAGNQYIEYSGGQRASDVIEYKDPLFKKKLEHILNKLHIPSQEFFVNE